MSSMHLTLNEKLSSEQIIAIEKRRCEHSIELMEILKINTAKLDTKEAKMKYVNACLPILVRCLF